MTPKYKKKCKKREKFNTNIKLFQNMDIFLKTDVITIINSQRYSNVVGLLLLLFFYAQTQIHWLYPSNVYGITYYMQYLSHIANNLC